MTSFTVKPDYTDYLAANWLIFRRYWFATKNIRGFVFMAATSLVLYLIVDHESPYDAIGQNALSLFLWATICWIGIFCISAASWPKRTRKVFDKLGTVDQTVDFTFSDSGFTADCKTGSTRLEWKHVTDFLYDGKSLVLRRTPAMIYIIPVSQLAPGVTDELVKVLQASSVEEG